MRRSIVDLEEIADVVGSPEAEERAQEVADHAVTLVKDRQGRASASSSGEHLSDRDDAKTGATSRGSVLIEEVKKRAPEHHDDGCSTPA